MELPSSSSTVLRNYLFASLLFLAQLIETVLPLPSNTQVPAVIAFGDSIVDPGNNNYLLTTPFKANVPPYGKDFMDGKPTGRFSNGKIPTDFLVEQLGIKELLPAYLDPNLKPYDLITGVSFASSASGYDPLTSTLLGVISLSDQLKMFREYIEKLKTIVGVESTEKIIKNSAYLVVAGSDDIANTYFLLKARQLHYNIVDYTEFVSEEAAKLIQELYELGAQRIAVFSTPPLGCLPSLRIVGGGIQQCVQAYNQAAVLYNSKLSSKLDELNANFKNAKAVYIDIYTPFLDIVENPSRYGFEVVNRGCCGSGSTELGIMCNDQIPSTCPNATKYVFWDSYHPTEKAYKDLVYPLFRKYMPTLICANTQCL